MQISNFFLSGKFSLHFLPFLIPTLQSSFFSFVPKRFCKSTYVVSTSYYPSTIGMKNPFKIKFCEKFGDRKIDGKFFSSWPFPKHLLKNIISVRARQQQQEIRTSFRLRLFTSPKSPKSPKFTF